MTTGRIRLAVPALLLLALAACGQAPVRGVLPAEAPPLAAQALPPQWPYPLDAPPAAGEHGMVVTDAPLATRVGVEVLREGGNAVDAAVATAFALAVVHPAAGNLGGGGFIVAHVGGRALALDFRETAPAAATRDMFLDREGLPGKASEDGPLAAGVPGSVAGLWEAHRKLGSLPWARLVEPAVRLAEEGFEVDADFARRVAGASRRLARYPASAASFLPGGEPPEEGSRWRNPDLAGTLRRIAAEGPDGFYKGETADLIVEEMRRGGGIMTSEDLAAYRAKWREPIRFTYRGREVLSMPPPSSGGIALALIAQRLGPHDLGGLGWHSPRSVHLQAEAMRRAFAVRNQMLGDPDFVPVPQARLLSRSFAETLGATISTTRATPSEDLSAALGNGGEGRHTTHFSVADREGNAVAMTTTLNLSFGSGVTVARAGFLLNDEMDDFASRPGTPNAFGLIQGEANAIAPHKRMLSSMTPAIVLDAAGKPLLVAGASGGPFIITTVFELLSQCLDDRMTAGAAIAAPRFHHQHLPDELRLESGGFTPGQVAALEAMGHRVRLFDRAKDDGSVAAVMERRGGVWYGRSDPRVHGLALGY